MASEVFATCVPALAAPAAPAVAAGEADSRPVPSVHDRCVVCGEGDTVLLVGREELRSELDWLHDFHARRLRADVSGEALADRATFTQEQPTDIVRCRGCGLVYRNPRPSARGLARAYRRDHYGQERLEALFASQLASNRRAAARLAAGLEPGARVLEIGSFVGAFLAAARELGLAASGIDPGREVADFCRRRGLRVFEGTIDEARPEAGSVQAVVIRNTFDQLTDPAAMLAWARSALAPRGVLVLRVPDGAWFAHAMRAIGGRPERGSRVLRAALAWNNHVGFPYLHGYSVETLDVLLGRHGFERIASRGDTLAILADRSTRPWARLEERAVKLWVRVAGALPGGDRHRLPWLDATYQLLA